MKVSCVQMEMALGRADENFAHAESLIRRAVEENAPDVVVLPETWNTGFFPENLALSADPAGRRTKDIFSQLAGDFNVNIVCGSVVTRKLDGFYNTAYVFDRQGQVVSEYDKTHLFSPAGEDRVFRPGDHLCAFALDGVACGLGICYDLRFPELARSLALAGAEVLFVMSQWPKRRLYHLDALARARAIENQVFLVLCNSAAHDTGCGGRSAILDPLGEPLAQAGEEETILSASLDLDALKNARDAIPVFRDRRGELYRL